MRPRMCHFSNHSTPFAFHQVAIVGFEFYHYSHKCNIFRIAGQNRTLEYCEFEPVFA